MVQRAAVIAEITPWIRRLARADTPQEAHDAVFEVESVLGRLPLDGFPHGLPWDSWAELEDLFSNTMLTGVPAEGALRVARRFAQDWLDTPPEHFETFLADVARRDFVEEVRSLGYVFQPPDPRSEQPWLGRWDSIRWSVEHVDVTHSPYASTQRILFELAHEPTLWRVGNGEQLTQLLRDWDNDRDRRSEIDATLRTAIASLSADDLPALKPR